MRELRNVVERAVLIAEKSVLDVEDFGLIDDTLGKIGSRGTSESLFPAIPPEGVDLPRLERALEKFYKTQ